MSNDVAPAEDAEMQQFQDDLLQSVREFKAGCLKSVINSQSRFVDEFDAALGLNECSLSK